MTQMQLTQGLRRAVQLNAERTAVVCGDRRRTWAEVASRVERLAGALAGLGATAGDRVAIIASNSDRYIEIFYAVAWAGCVVVPCNVRFAEVEQAVVLAETAPRVIFADPTGLGTIADYGLAPDQTIVVLDDDTTWPGALAYEAIIADAQPLDDQKAGGDALAAIFYTGGTTGTPKGVMLSHANLMSNFLACGALGVYAPDCIFLEVAPMFHMAGASAVFAVTAMGGTHVVLPGFDAAAVVSAIVAERVDSLILVPTMIGMLEDHLRRYPAKLGGVTRLTYGASPISESLLALAMSIFPNAEFRQAYGQTELSPVATLLEPRHHQAVLGEPDRLRSAGRPIPGVDVEIVDDDLRPVARGEIGEVVARGPGVMLGYWKRPDLTTMAVVEGWVRTGDAGFMDKDGFVFLVDRLKDMIVSGGENVYAAEVERALGSHPAVLECAVIGAPDERWGERVHAVVRFRPGEAADEVALRRHCQTLIADYKRPRSYDIRQEALPVSAAGKILKTELRRALWGERARAVN